MNILFATLFAVLFFLFGEQALAYHFDGYGIHPHVVLAYILISTVVLATYNYLRGYHHNYCVH